jgi:hypothetical protein
MSVAPYNLIYSPLPLLTTYISAYLQFYSTNTVQISYAYYVTDIDAARTGDSECFELLLTQTFLLSMYFCLFLLEYASFRR